MKEDFSVNVIKNYQERKHNPELSKVGLNFGKGLGWSVLSILICVACIVLPGGYVLLMLFLKGMPKILLMASGIFYLGATVFSIAFVSQKAGDVAGVSVGPLLVFAVYWSLFYLDNYDPSQRGFMSFFATLAVILISNTSRFILPSLTGRLQGLAEYLYFDAKPDTKGPNLVFEILLGIGFYFYLGFLGFDLNQTTFVVSAIILLSIYFHIVTAKFNFQKLYISALVPAVLLGAYLLFFFEKGMIGAIVKIAGVVVVVFGVIGLAHVTDD